MLYWLNLRRGRVSAMSSCALIRNRSTNITRVFVIHRGPEEKEERPQEGCHCIFTTLCCGAKKPYYYSVINQAFLRRGGLSAEMIFLHSIRSKHRGELSTQEYDAWDVTQRQPCFLQRAHPWLMQASPITRYRACVRTRIFPHTREIETFFRDMTALTYENNFDAAIPSLGTVDSLPIAEIF